MRSSEQINELAAALAKAQSQMVAAKKSEKNPYFKSSYADLANVIANDRKALTENGLSVAQGASMLFGPPNAEAVPVAVNVCTRLCHSSGQWIEESAMAVPKDFGPQAVGATITYLRRYGYQAMVGATAEGDDDDGESAQGRGNGKGGVKEEKKPLDPFEADRKWLNLVYLRLRKNAHLVPLSDGQTLDGRMKKMSEDWSKSKESIPSMTFLVKKWREQIEPYVKQANEKEYAEWTAEFNARVEKEGVEF